MTETTEIDRRILSGLFALSNMGQPTPRDVREIVERLRANPRTTVECAMMAFCQNYMESDEHQSMFHEEAKHWYKNTFSKAKYTVEEIWRVWPSHADEMWPAPVLRPPGNGHLYVARWYVAGGRVIGDLMRDGGARTKDGFVRKFNVKLRADGESFDVTVGQSGHKLRFRMSSKEIVLCP